MTSQLFLFNQRGVVVASDTLATRKNSHGGWSGLPDNSKIFALGEQHRVVVASSDCTQISKVHVELLVHEWSASLTEPVATLEDYVESFVSWTNSTLKTMVWNNKSGALEVVRHELHDLIGITEIRRLASAHSRGEVDDATSEIQMIEDLKVYASQNFLSAEYEDLPLAKAKHLVQKLKKKVVKLFAEATGEPDRKYSSEFKDELMNFFSQLLCRFVPATEGIATLNFIGYGTEVLFPGRIQMDIRGFYAGKLRYRVRHFRNGASDRDPAFQPHAQSSAIDGFINGIGDDFRRALPSAADDLMSRMTSISDDERKKFCQDLNVAVNEIVRHHFANPFLAALGGMSMTQMVQLADQLIQLQCLRSQLSDCDVTVGGPVEVVSVDRNQGVVWHRSIPAAALTQASS